MRNRNITYTTALNLTDNEVAARVDTETGEVTEIKRRGNNIPEGRIKMNNGNFKQPSNYALDWAYNNLNDTQLRMMLKLLSMAGKDNTLKPLNDDTGITVLVEYFKLSPNTIKRNLDILFQKGIYGRFEVAEAHSEITKYWILNPYLSISQGTVLGAIENLFSNTEIALYCKMRKDLR